MLILSFGWLFLLIAELVHGFTPVLFALGSIVWGLFILQFALKYVIADNKLYFLKTHWLLALALAIPVLRILKLQEDFPWVGYLTASSGAQLVWVFCSINRGMQGLRVTMQRRGATYVMLLTLIVLFVGAAGMSYFEQADPTGQGIPEMGRYPQALWWTAMQMTTIGSAYSPITPGGQVISFAISLYACAVFGYLTAILATFFIGVDAADPNADLAGQSDFNKLSDQISALRKDLQDLKGKSSRNVADISPEEMNEFS